jgi:hypothetical protein
MSRQRRTFSASERAEIWRRWRKGERVADIARALTRTAPAVHYVVKSTGGFAPRPRERSARWLSAAEREEISRASRSAYRYARLQGNSNDRPRRFRAKLLATADGLAIEPRPLTSRRWSERVARSSASSLSRRGSESSSPRSSRVAGRRSKSQAGLGDTIR